MPSTGRWRRRPLSETSYNIAIVGAGAAGLSAALAFARDGFKTVLIGDLDVRRDGRTVALSTARSAFWRPSAYGLRLVPGAAPLQTMRIIDDTGSLFRPPPASFRAG